MIVWLDLAPEIIILIGLLGMLAVQLHTRAAQNRRSREIRRELKESFWERTAKELDRRDRHWAQKDRDGVVEDPDFASWNPTPAQIALEASLLLPTTQLVAEAEAAEERRWVKIYGPEDAPERPPWPVEWCEECHGWSPTDAWHSHGTPSFAPITVEESLRPVAYVPVGPTGPTGAATGPTGATGPVGALRPFDFRERMDFLTHLSIIHGIPLEDLKAVAPSLNLFAPQRYVVKRDNPHET